MRIAERTHRTIHPSHSPAPHGIPPAARRLVAPFQRKQAAARARRLPQPNSTTPAQLGPPCCFRPERGAAAPTMRRTLPCLVIGCGLQPRSEPSQRTPTRQRRRRRGAAPCRWLRRHAPAAGRRCCCCLGQPTVWQRNPHYDPGYQATSVATAAAEATLAAGAASSPPGERRCPGALLARPKRATSTRRWTQPSRIWPSSTQPGRTQQWMTLPRMSRVGLPRRACGLLSRAGIAPLPASAAWRESGRRLEQRLLPPLHRMPRLRWPVRRRCAIGPRRLRCSTA
jgi:hypothetical protein